MQQIQQRNKEDETQAVKLMPKAQPGRPNRKLVAHLEEIKRLRTEGYSVAAIHGALLEAGVHVGLRTVFLEVAKLTDTAPQQTAEPSKPARTASPIAIESTGESITPPGAVATGEKKPFPNVDVDEFFRNPLNRNPFLKGRLK